MKKLVLGAAAAAAVAAPLAVAPAIAGATGGGTTPPANSITISSIADYGLNGTNLDIDLQVRCTGGSGFVEVTVDQAYPDAEPARRVRVQPAHRGRLRREEPARERHHRRHALRRRPGGGVRDPAERSREQPEVDHDRRALTASAGT